MQLFRPLSRAPTVDQNSVPQELILSEHPELTCGFNPVVVVEIKEVIKEQGHKFELQMHSSFDQVWT